MSAIPYTTDQLTWCVSHAKRMPVWKNILKFAKDKYVAMLSLISYYLISAAVFFWAGYEQLNWDIWKATSKSLQVALQVGISLRSGLRCSTLIVFASGLFGAFVNAATVLCFYISVIQIQFDEDQIATKSDLIVKRFELAGESGILSMINDGQLVC